jgi:dolichyl-phosphate-mannose-protein mannosyltransferase
VHPNPARYGDRAWPAGVRVHGGRGGRIGGATYDGAVTDAPVATDRSAGTGPPPEPPATTWARSRLSRRAAAQPGRQRPVATLGLRARLLGTAASDRFWGWAGPLIVTVIGGFFRFWHLDQPHKLVFDETYYVKQGYSYLKVGYELAWRSDVKPDDLFTKGNLNVFKAGPDFVVHPPVGKWMIAAGEWIFGPTSSWGWRFSAALVGTLSLLMIGRIGRRLFGSTLLGTTAALLLAIDGQHLVHSRTGILDIFVMFWALAGFGCLLVDRDRARERLARRVEASGGTAEGLGPWLGVRWWRLAGAVCLGLCAGVKWSGVFFVAAFLVMSVLWDVSARRAAGVRRWVVAAVVRDGLFAVVTTVPLVLATYLAAWTGWFRSTGGYDRQWAVTHPSSTWGWVPATLRSLWHYHAEMWQFNVTLHSPHPYQSNPWSWIVLGRPTDFFYEGSKAGEGACHLAAGCSRAITPIGNPVVWWGGTIAIAVLLVCWALGRDWRAGAVLAGLAAGWLPWFHFQDRTIYTFYAVAFVPWVVLALTYCLGLLLGPRTAGRERRLYGGIAAGSIVVVAVVLFALFHPVYVADLIPQPAWADRMWLPSWI